MAPFEAPAEVVPLTDSPAPLPTPSTSTTPSHDQVGTGKQLMDGQPGQLRILAGVNSTRGGVRSPRGEHPERGAQPPLPLAALHSVKQSPSWSTVARAAERRESVWSPLSGTLSGSHDLPFLPSEGALVVLPVQLLSKPPQRPLGTAQQRSTRTDLILPLRIFPQIPHPRMH